jgi:hypothetical protein
MKLSAITFPDRATSWLITDDLETGAAIRGGISCARMEAALFGTASTADVLSPFTRRSTVPPREAFWNGPVSKVSRNVV